MSNLTSRDELVVWHPFTQSGMQQPELLEVHSASGAQIRLSDGRSLIDGISSWWCNAHGHCHPKLVAALTQQARVLDHVLFAGCTHEPAVALAEGLLKVLPPSLSRIFYSDNGSTAVEVALKIAVQYWRNQGERRTRFVALTDAYHGDTFGAMAAGERGIFSAPFEEMMFQVERLSIVGGDDEAARCAELAASGDVAGFIFEPGVQGAGGMKMYCPQIVDRYIAEFQKAGVPCIADEVMTGFGRTGPLFVSTVLRNAPDIICLSKALTGGMLPLAVTAVSKKICELFVSHDHSRTFFHGHTFTANPLACAVGLASLELSCSQECEGQRIHIEQRHRECARELSTIEGVVNPRVAGTILAFDLDVPDGTSGYTASIAHEARNFFSARGVLIRPLGNVLYFMPPYCITDSELDAAYLALRSFCLKQ